MRRLIVSQAVLAALPDSQGRIVTICVGLSGPTLKMLDPRTLDEIASFSLPPRQPPAPGDNIFQDFAPVTIGPDGTAYVGVLGGLVALRDRTPPPQGLVDTSVEMDDSFRPKLALRLSATRGCSARVRASVAGADRGLVTRVDFKLGNRRAGVDAGAPFTRTIRVQRRRPQTIRAIAVLGDGERRILRRTLPARCRNVAPALTG